MKLFRVDLLIETAVHVEAEDEDEAILKVESMSVYDVERDPCVYPEKRVTGVQLDEEEPPLLEA